MQWADTNVAYRDDSAGMKMLASYILSKICVKSRKISSRRNYVTSRKQSILKR